MENNEEFYFKRFCRMLEEVLDEDARAQGLEQRIKLQGMEDYEEQVTQEMDTQRAKALAKVQAAHQKRLEKAQAEKQIFIDAEVDRRWSAFLAEQLVARPELHDDTIKTREILARTWETSFKQAAMRTAGMAK